VSPGLGTILFTGLGYVLVYAAVANHGRFATHPWAGLLEDAYTGNRSTAAGGTVIAPEDQGRPPAGPQGPTAPAAGTVVRTRRPRPGVAV